MVVAVGKIEASVGVATAESHLQDVLARIVRNGEQHFRFDWHPSHSVLIMLNGHPDCGKNIPGQQLMNAVDCMIGNACQYAAQIGLRIEPVQLSRANQAVDGGSTFSASIRARKEIVLPPNRDRT